MKKSQKLHNSQWIAHNIKSTDVFELTLRVSLMECKASYIREQVLILDSDEDLPDLDLISEYQDAIPDDVKFIIVKLVPNFVTETP